MPDLTLLGPKLAKLIPRLASDHDGEIIATARAIQRTLAGGGCDWHDLAGVVEKGGVPAVKAARKPRKAKASAKQKTKPPAPKQYYPAAPRLWADLTVDERLDLLRKLIRSGRLTAWEIDLCSSIGLTIRDHPHITQSEKQQAILDRLAAKLREGRG